MRHRWWAWLLVGLAVLAVAAALGFVIWAETPLGPMPEAVMAMATDESVTVDQNDVIVFRPNGAGPTEGLIFYPGARIDPESYAPAMRDLAAQGFLVVVTPMPLNLAVLDSDKAAEVVAEFPEIQRWAVGGHSLGGAMAAAFVASDPMAVYGLVLWAAYPSSGDDLSAWPGRVTSVFATNDGLTTPDDIVRTMSLLPGDTEFVVIEGGNHSQFGWYGEQRGDGVAEISREEQQSRIVAATLGTLRALPAAGD
jgi:pimeloyl-ACP methyl ester carboxylesterase